MSFFLYVKDVFDMGYMHNTLYSIYETHYIHLYFNLS